MRIPSSDCVSVSGASTTGSTTITTCNSNYTITTNINSLSSKSKTNVGGSGSGIPSSGDAGACDSASNIDLFRLSCPSVSSYFTSLNNTPGTSYASVLSNPSVNFSRPAKQAKVSIPNSLSSTGSPKPSALQYHGGAIPKIRNVSLDLNL